MIHARIWWFGEGKIGGGREMRLREGALLDVGVGGMDETGDAATIL